MECADCGVDVEWHRDRWAHRAADGEFVYACRGTVERNPDGVPYRWTAIDYHYVEGEVQRHFRAPRSG